MTKAELNRAVKIKMREKRIAAGLTIPELYAPCEPSGE